MRFLWLLFSLMFLVTGCTRKAWEPEYGYANAYGDDGVSGGALRLSDAEESEKSYLADVFVEPAPASMKPKKQAPSATMVSDQNSVSAAPSDDRAPDVNTVQPTAGRMVHYDGHAELRVTRISETADTIVRIATQAGGHLEQMGRGYVMVRVPVAQFDAVFKTLLGLGDVVSKTISAEDVTESFQSTDLRLRTARAARDRLVALLAKATEEEEKLRLVREIQRVSEQIDRLESQVRTLEQLASFSRITIELTSREALAWSDADDETAEFTWIRQVSPFGSDRVRAGKTLRLAVPEGMVALSPRGPFVAESPDGARIWSGRLLNQPRGDAAFWLAALRQRLGPDFAETSVITIGDYQLLRLVDRSDEPYVWMVGVATDGKNLKVIEIYFPSFEHEQRYRDAVVSALTGGAT